MSAFFYYYFFQKIDFETILIKSAVAGSLHASGFISKKKECLKKIDKIAINIKVKSFQYDK